MLAYACPCAEAESSIGIILMLLLIKPSERIEFLWILKVLLVIVVRQKLYFYPCSLHNWDIVNAYVFGSLSQHDTRCWPIDSISLQQYPLEIVNISNLLKCNIL